MRRAQCSRHADSSAPHHSPTSRLCSAPTLPWRTGWSGRSAAQPLWVTVTRVPLGLGSNTTSTSVRSAGAKLRARQSNSSRRGGSQTRMRPISITRSCAPTLYDSNTRPPSLGSSAIRPLSPGALRKRGPRRHHSSISSVKSRNASCGGTATPTVTRARSPAVRRSLSISRCALRYSPWERPGGHGQRAAFAGAARRLMCGRAARACAGCVRRAP